VNTDISDIDSEINDRPEQEKKPRRGGSALALLAIFIALTALAGTAWMWRQNEMAREHGNDPVFAEIARLKNAESELFLKLKQVLGQVESLADHDNSAQNAQRFQRTDSQ